MKAIYFGIIILLATTFSSCEKKAEESTNAMILHEAPAMESRMQAPPMRDKVDGAMDNIKPNTESEPKVASKKKIIKDGSISVKTNDIAASKKSIDEALKKYNAYYETEDLQNNDQTTSYDLKIRIPAQNFESLIAAIENGKDEIKS